MAGHFDSIGFPADDEEELAPLIRRARVEGDQLELLGAEAGYGGRYICWNAGGNAQLWLAVDEKNRIARVDPHFAGRGRADVVLERSYDYDEGEPAPPAGGVVVTVAPGTAEETRAAIDLPAYGRFWDMACDADGNALMQVAAFCHGGVALPDDDAFVQFMDEQRQEGEHLAFATESFLPVGLLAETDASAPDLPPALARLSGRVLEAKRVTNPQTGRAFWSALVKTAGMTLDVVADDEQLDGVPVRGGIVAGSFWLSGLPAEGPRRSGGVVAIDASSGITITRVSDD